MKKLLLFILFIYQFNGFAQFNESAPWMENVKKDAKGEATVEAIREAFDLYWKDHDKNKRGSGYKPFKRWETHWQEKTDANGYIITPEQLWNAWNQKRLAATQRIETQSTLSNWQPLGPFNHVNTGSWSPGQGRVNVVYVDPTNASTLYIGAPAGGIWKSTDAGLNWTPLSDFLPQIGVSGIVVDYTNPNIIYIATGDKDASDTYSIGVLKSTDGGLTWNTTGLQFTNTTTVAADIFMHPSNPSILWVATSAGLYKTINAGLTWTRPLTGNIKDLKLKPGNPDVVYAVSTNRFFRSTNGGDTFTQISSGMPANSGRLIIDVTPANPEYVYVLSARTDWGHQGLYKSTNSGLNFTRTSNTVDIFEADQAWFDLALAVSDSNPEEVYTGVLNVWKSSNGGNTFTRLNSWSNPFQPTYTHADIHFLRFYNGILYCGSDGGVYVSNNNGASFTDLTATAQIGQFYRIGLSKQSSSKIAGGLQDNGGYALSNNLWKNYFGADGMEAVIDPTNPNKYYGFIQNGSGLYFTNNSGNQLSGSISAPNDLSGNWITPLAINSVGELFAGYNGVYKLINSSWQLVSNSLITDGNLERITIDKTNDDIIYIADGRNLLKSEDRGVNFFNCTTFSSNITSIEVNSNNNQIVYVSTSGTGGSVFQSTNGGFSFTNIGAGLPLIAKTVVKHQGLHVLNPLYVGTTLGVYYKDDSLSEWVPYDTGLPNVTVTDIEIHEIDQKIVASTYGRGVWESPIPTQMASNEIALLGIESQSSANIDCNNSQIAFNIQNSGLESISSFTLNYTINGISNSVNWEGNIPSLASTTVVVQNLNLPKGNNLIAATVVMANDTFSNNNSFSGSLLTNDMGQVGVINTFEGNHSDWLISQEGTTTVWERGIPSGLNLNTAFSGTQVYATNLTGNYSNNQKGYLYSSCYDLTSVVNPILRFKMAFNLELNWDLVYLQYSTNQGETWSLLGTANDPNWYNSNRFPNNSNCFNCVGAQWTGTNLLYQEYSLPLSFLQNESNVIFRFVFHSDESVTFEGVVMDDFSIDGTLSIPSNQNLEMTVYPNPTNGFVSVFIPMVQSGSIEVFDISGKNVKKQAISNTQTELDLSSLSAGVYLLKATTPENQFIKRIIKN
ncbi:T9SS type A sorting domain-containing protein [Flavobacterium sp.]|uniref:T9SS type A sorting domain-containing protein n=1 Tax=Flavobacterium sp. TaxID=239 RepID=UPI002FD9C1BE